MVQSNRNSFSLPLHTQEMHFVSIQTNFFVASWQLSCKGKTNKRPKSSPALGNQLLNALKAFGVFGEGWGSLEFASLWDRGMEFP